jgi:hypothetical protein
LRPKTVETLSGGENMERNSKKGREWPEERDHLDVIIGVVHKMRGVLDVLGEVKSLPELEENTLSQVAMLLEDQLEIIEASADELYRLAAGRRRPEVDAGVAREPLPV